MMNCSCSAACGCWWKILLYGYIQWLIWDAIGMFQSNMADMKVARRRTERISGSGTKTCVYWLAGRCNRNPCRFLHSETPLTSTSSYSCARKRHFSSEYDKTLPNHNSKSVFTRKSGDGAPVAEAYQKPSQMDQYNARNVYNHAKKHRSSPESEKTLSKCNSVTALIKKNGDGRDAKRVADASQNPSLSICRYWMNDNCVHGDQCRNLHSWFNGDGFSTLAKLQGHKKFVSGIALSAGLDKLYSGSTDGTLRTWDCHTGQCANVVNLGAEVNSLITEGPWIFVGLQNAVKAWNIETASQFTLDGPKGRILAMVVGNDTLLAGAEDGVISAWRGSSEASSPFELVASLSGHTKAVVCLTVGCTKKLFSGSMDQTIRVWDLDTLECKMTLNGHTGVVTSLICWDYYLLSGSSDCTIKVWVATEEGTLKVTYSHPVDNGVVALSGMTDAEAKPILFCSSKDNSVHMYELPSFAERGRLFAKKEVGSIEIGPGGLFFTGDGTGLVTAWKWLEEPKVAASS